MAKLPALRNSALRAPPYGPSRRLEPGLLKWSDFRLEEAASNSKQCKSLHQQKKFPEAFGMMYRDVLCPWTPCTSSLVPSQERVWTCPDAWSEDLTCCQQARCSKKWPYSIPASKTLRYLHLRCCDFNGISSAAGCSSSS